MHASRSSDRKVEKKANLKHFDWIITVHPVNVFLFVRRCCYVHDQCYSKISKKKICPFKEAVYTTVYIVKGCSRCGKSY